MLYIYNALNFIFKLLNKYKTIHIIYISVEINYLDFNNDYVCVIKIKNKLKFI
jgi:hypothetical protein